MFVISWSQLAIFRDVDHDDHPFQEVVVISTSNSTEIKVWSIETVFQHQFNIISQDFQVVLRKRGITLKTALRTSSPEFDWCEAAVDSDSFMYLNTYFNVRRNVQLLMASSGSRSIVAGIEFESDYCTQFQSCKMADEQARVMNPAARHHVLDHEIVFNTKERTRFCVAWKTAFPEVTYNKGSQCGLEMAPTATSYLSHIGLKPGLLSSLYVLQDKAKYGWRSPFIEKIVPPKCDSLGPRRRLLGNSSSSSIKCSAIENQVLRLETLQHHKFSSTCSPWLGHLFGERVLRMERPICGVLHEQYDVDFAADSSADLTANGRAICSKCLFRFHRINLSYQCW